MMALLNSIFFERLLSVMLVLLTIHSIEEASFIVRIPRAFEKKFV